MRVIYQDGTIAECPRRTNCLGLRPLQRGCGGIADAGSCISDCISMVQIADYTLLDGAAAGEITGEYSNNHFVSDAQVQPEKRRSCA